MPAIIIKNYEHFNRSFPNWDTPKGKYIRNKDEYDREMKTHNMRPYEESLDKAKYSNLKPLKISDKALEIIRAAKATKDKKGNVKLGDRTIDAMREIGAIGKKIPDYVKKEYAQGFSL